MAWPNKLDFVGPFRIRPASNASALELNGKNIKTYVTDANGKVVFT